MIRAAELYPKAKSAFSKFEKETGRRIRKGSKRRKAWIALTLAFLREQGYAVPDEDPALDKFEKKLDNRLRRSKQALIRR